ncbi:MAG: adenosylcobinamide-phosphate synthase CbiB [Nitrospirota bacterium]
MITPIQTLIAYLLDIAFGDPRWLPHPVVCIGRGIGVLEKMLRSYAKNALPEKIGGAIIAVVVIAGTYILSTIFITVSYRISDISGTVVTIFLAYTTLATRSLGDVAYKIIYSLKERSISEARKNLSMIVGRDTESLEEKEILRASVESIAENTSDGIVAPLLYLAVGGVPAAMAYKAVNTLDSMLGYKNERYINIGWASARIDDIVNFIPARITGVLIAASVFVLSLIRRLKPASTSFSRFSLPTSHFSLKIMLSDGRKHPSPNAGIPEAAMAGALGVRLGGEASYSGIKDFKPYIGEGMNTLDASKVEDAVRIMYTSSLLMLLFTLSVQILKGLFI